MNEKIRIRRSYLAYSSKPTKDDMFVIMAGMKKELNSVEVTYKELAGLILKGHSVLLADFNKKYGVEEGNIKQLNCIALDIDSKEHKITIGQMVNLLRNKLKISPVIAYNTFSDVDNTKFRLIYRFENPVDVETYRKFYEALQLKFNKYLDSQTKNANRVWAGTNKGVHFSENDKPISFELIVKAIKWLDRIKTIEQKKKFIEVKKGYKEYKNEDYIRPECKKEVLELLVSNCSLKDFIEKHFGGKFRYEKGNFVGNCSIHGGDNPTALVISEKIWTCFTHCGTGNIFTLAKKVYGINNFSRVAFLLANEYNIVIPEKYIRRVY